jgi:hypothetical protein
MPSNQICLDKNEDPSGIAFYSTLLNILVAGTKGGLAWLSGSSALLADTIHGFSDTFASLLVFVGICLLKIKSETFSKVFIRNQGERVAREERSGSSLYSEGFRRQRPFLRILQCQSGGYCDRCENSGRNPKIVLQFCPLG